MGWSKSTEQRGERGSCRGSGQGLSPGEARASLFRSCLVDGLRVAWAGSTVCAGELSSEFRPFLDMSLRVFRNWWQVLGRSGGRRAKAASPTIRGWDQTRSRGSWDQATECATTRRRCTTESGIGWDCGQISLLSE